MEAPDQIEQTEQNEPGSLLGKRSVEEMMKDDVPNTSVDQIEEGKQDDGNESQDDDAGESKLVPGEIDPLRLCLQGLDNFTMDKDIVKFCKKEFNPPIELTAVSKKKGKGHAFLTFATIEEKERFEKEAGNKKIKNRKIKVKPVRSDHQALKFEKKIKTIEHESNKPKQPPKQEDIDAEMSVPIQEKVCPLWKTPYEEQVKAKRDAMEAVLKKISVNAGKSLKQEKQDQDFWPYWLKEKPEGPCVELSDFIGADADKTFYYRNKAEFTIGESYLEKGRTKVGFNVGNFNKGFMFVESAAECPIVSKEALALADILEKYIQNCGLPAYQRMEHKGFWRNFLVRQSETAKEILLSLVVAKDFASAEDFERVKQELITLFTTEFKGFDSKIVSILVQDHSGISDNIPFDAPIEIIYGDRDYYNDEIMGFKFRVNISAFLQVNSSQCEKLYSLVKKVAGIDSNTVVLDICCGIGTIGICAASNAKKIVGIEMVDRAIKDAEYNSQLNGLTNTEWHAAKVESIIADVIKPYMGSNKIIGIVDPPRAGLHKDVIKALRTCKGLDKLVYVSCNPEGTMVENVLGLCLPENKRRRAPAFTVTEAYGVDLFPQTHHFEGVLVLERLYGQRKEKKAE